MKPTILYVTEIKPYPLYGGMYIHIYNVLESLCKDYNVIVLSPPVDEECPLRKQVVAWYPLPAYPIHWWNKMQNGVYVLRPRPEWERALKSILQRHRPDGVWFTYGHWGQYAPLIQQHGAFALMMAHNIQSELTRQRAITTPPGLLRGLTQLRAWAEALHERTLFRNFDCVVSLTEIDRRYHAQFIGDQQSILIPGYLDERRYQQDDQSARIEREEKLLILTGSFQSFQNSQGLRWFFDKVWPQICHACPGVRLQLVGMGAAQLPIHPSIAQPTSSQGTPTLGGAAVEVIDSIPDVIPYLQRATIALVPIHHGSGIRFKVLEALAAELPIVSTTLGAQGIAVQDKKSILLADCVDEFAAAVVSLLQNPQKRNQLAQNGQKVFNEHYTMTAVSTQIQTVVTHLLNQYNRSSRSKQVDTFSRSYSGNVESVIRS